MKNDAANITKIMNASSGCREKMFLHFVMMHNYSLEFLNCIGDMPVLRLKNRHRYEMSS
jgi:hypothetical protein